MASTFQTQCSALSKNDHVILKGLPGKIVEAKSSKKHNHAKIHLVAVDMFTGKKLEDFCPRDQNMDCPNVTHTDYQFSHIEDGFLHLMAANDIDAMQTDVKVPDGDLGEKIEACEEAGLSTVITVISAMGEEVAISAKEA